MQDICFQKVGERKKKGRRKKKQRTVTRGSETEHVARPSRQTGSWPSSPVTKIGTMRTFRARHTPRGPWTCQRPEKRNSSTATSLTRYPHCCHCYPHYHGCCRCPWDDRPPLPPDCGSPRGPHHRGTAGTGATTTDAAGSSRRVRCRFDSKRPTKRCWKWWWWWWWPAGHCDYC